jgi:S-DNA-T family DNA segregation ATPase FtsK/SpoIIIE
MGKTIFGEVFTDDLSKMPHILIAGSTGSGKSVGINTILASLLYRMHPSDLKLVIIDPKKIELSQYAKLRQHFLAISPDVEEEIITSPRNAVLALKGVEYEMEKRYGRLAAAGVRSIVDYNDRLRSGKLKNTETMTHSRMPYLVVIIDELADLMITAAREVEEPIARLAQLARAVGIHLVVATQRPSVDVITGVIKANFPARIAYQVASKVDSRTILDTNGAEQLLGNGDMLYLASGSPKPVRLQNAFISTDEVDAIVDHIAGQQGFVQPFMLPSITEKKGTGGEAGGGERDELFQEAARLIVRHQQGSVSLLQRRLKVGYSRAARLVDELEAAGIVGPFDGSKARDVLVESEIDLEQMLKNP